MGLLGIGTNPYVSAGLGLLGAVDQAFAFNRAENLNIKHEGEIRGILEGRMSGGVQMSRDFGRRQNQAYGQRTAMVMREINKMGQQGRSDVQRTFGNRRFATQANLAGRGLAGTSLASSAAHGSAREESAALSRHAEAIGGLRGSSLSALKGDQLAGRERSMNRLLQTFLNTSGDYANFINSISAPHPNNNPLVQQMAAAGVQPPERSSGSVWIPTAINVGSDLLSAPGEGIGAFGQGFSDRRLKENISPIGDPGSYRDVQPVRFKWKKNAVPVGVGEGWQVGVIAQDVQLLYPEVVFLSDSGYLGVDYEALVMWVPELRGALISGVPDDAHSKT